MRIRELTVLNYRPFQDRPPFSFSDRFTIIAGINGRGKTAILDALALAASRLLPQISPAFPSYRYLSLADIHHGQHAIKINLKATCAGYPVDEFEVTFDDNLKQTRHTQLPRSVKEEIRRRYGEDKTRSDDAAPVAVYYTTDRAGFRKPKSLPRAAPRGQRAAYAGALRNRTVGYRDFMNRLRKDLRLEYEARMRTAADFGAGKSPDEEGWGTEPTAYDPNPAYLGRSTVDSITEVLRDFIGNFSNLRVEINPLRLMVDKEGVPLDLGQLSDGERSFLAMITDLSRRLVLANPRLRNPLHGEGVVLIDELELHLHPKWQLEAVEKLRNHFPNIQFIATTHSPFVLQTARPGEVAKLDGDLTIEPAGRSVEEVARLVMGITNVERSPRYQDMVETAHRYLALAEEAKTADPGRREEIRQQLLRMLAPFTDNPAYTALLERKGIIDPGN